MNATNLPKPWRDAAFFALLPLSFSLAFLHLEPLRAELAPTEPVRHEPSRIETTPKLENLNQQIAANAEDAQAYTNRGYTLALLGRKEEARADLVKAVAIKDTGPMHNRAGWAYFNMGDYADAVREFEIAVKLSNYHAHYDYYSLVLAYWGVGKVRESLENYQLAVEHDPRFGSFKTLDERTAEWTPLERRAIHETYILWSKTWKP